MLTFLTRFSPSTDDLQLIFTQDGLEYVTPKQLWREIEQEIADQGGRRTIFGLASFLGVDSVHVDRLVSRNAITFHSSSSIQRTSTDSAAQLINADSSIVSISAPCVYFLSDSNELLDSTYNTKLIRALNEQLQSSGIANIEDFASQRSLPVSYFERLIKKCLEDCNIVDCEYDAANRTLLRPEFREKFCTILRASLSAVTRPISVMKLVAGWKGMYYTSSLVNYAVDRIEAENSSIGTFSGKLRENRTFTPSIYITARDSWVNNALAKDMYISLSTLQKLGFVVGSQEPIFRDNICLPNSIVSHALIEHIKVSIQEATTEQHILPLTPPLVPEDLEEIDLKAMCSKIDFSGLGRLYSNKWFIPQAIEERCLQLFQQEIDDDARRRAELEKQNADIISASKPIAPEPITFTHPSAHEFVKRWLPSERKYEVALSLMTEKLLPKIQAMCASSGAKSTLKVDNSWKSSEWLAQFEIAHLNMAFFLKSIETLSTAISPEQRSQLTSHACETLLPSILTKLREAFCLKFLLPTLPDEDFLLLVPSDVAKHLSVFISEASTLNFKKYLKITSLLLATLGLEAPALTPKVSETILGTHRSSAASQLKNTSVEPSTKMRLVLSLLHAKLKNAMLLSTAKHLNLLIHITKSELKSNDNPIGSSASNDEILSQLDATYAALLNTIRAKQSKNAETLAVATATFNGEIDKLIILVN